MDLPVRGHARLLVRYLRPQIGQVALLAIVLWTNIALQLLNPLIMRRFLDSALAGGALESLTRLAILFMGIAVVQQVTAVSSTVLAENVGWRATNALRYDLARHCLHLDLSFHQQRTPGEMIERIDGDINALTRFFSQFIVQIFGNSLLLLGVLVLLFREDMRVGASIGLFVLVSLLLLIRIRNVAVPYWQRSREASARFFSFVEERLAGTEDIRASGAETFTLYRFHQLLRTFWQTTVRAQLWGFSMINIAWILFSVGNAIAFVVGARLYSTGVLTIGTVYLIFHYTNVLSMPMQRIAQEFEQLQQATAGIVRIQELFVARSRLGTWSDNGRPLAAAPAIPPATPPRGPLSVDFDRASFAYPADGQSQPVDVVAREQFAIDQLSLAIAPGEVVGLLGRTGSGKTTLTRLLMRLYDVNSGQVRIGGQDVRDWPLRQLRAQVGMVTQNVQLFQASIRDNLTFFDTSIPDQQIHEAIEILGLADWYASLGTGLDAQLLTGGRGMSAGEAQLLAFTRIFLRDPGLIILDEASSRLDPATEALLEQAIDQLLRNRTGILIAHRLGTVQRADTIVILENGKIREQGSRNLLAADSSSHYAHLLRMGLQEVLV